MYTDHLAFFSEVFESGYSDLYCTFECRRHLRGFSRTVCPALVTADHLELKKTAQKARYFILFHDMFVLGASA